MGLQSNLPGKLPNAEVAELSQRTQSLTENEISEAIIGRAIEVQRQLGTGLLESAYSAALELELDELGLPFQREVPVLATYKGKPLGVVYRADFIVGSKVFIEVKAVDGISDAHRAQLLSYLRVSGLRLGLLINFHAAPLAARGIARMVNQL